MPNSSISLFPLPPEIWRIIFAFAVRPCVHVSSALDASDSGHSLDPLALGVAATRPTILRTKMALLLVCKLWHGAAREILYEHVSFNSQESLTRSLAALVESGSDTSPSPFHCTKSLILYVFDWEQWDIPVTKILKLCENLRTLVLGYYPGKSQYEGDAMPLVINAIPSNLVALAYIGPYHKNMTETLNSFQKLEFLSLLSPTPLWRDPPNCRPIFPHVRHITLSHDSSGWNSYFPDARHLSIVISHDGLHSFQNQNINPTNESKIEHLSIVTKTWFPRYLKFGDVIFARFIQGFQNLIILSYNPFTLDISRSHPFETHPTLQSVRHYIEIPMVNHEGKEVGQEVLARFKASWVGSWHWLHSGEDKFSSLQGIIGVYKCRGANEIEKELLGYVQGLGRHDPKLTFACTLQCKEM